MKLLLIGYDLDIVGSCCEPESHCYPIPYLDLIYIHLGAAVFAAFYNGAVWQI
jgi:hypothetical protein